MVYEAYNVDHPEDELNFNHYRTANNTDKCFYNCGGFALNTFSWYEPNLASNSPWDIWCDWSQAYMEKVTKMCTAQMLSDFPDLRQISQLSEVGMGEYAIAFRVSSDGDFHFVKRESENHWLHKQGDSYEIESMTTKEVFSKEWCFRYDGPIVLFAKRVA